MNQPTQNFKKREGLSFFVELQKWAMDKFMKIKERVN